MVEDSRRNFGSLRSELLLCTGSLGSPLCLHVRESAMDFKQGMSLASQGLLLPFAAALGALSPVLGHLEAGRLRCSGRERGVGGSTL